MSADQRATIAEISETVGEAGARTTKVKPHDKLAALDKLARVFSLCRERVEVSGPQGGPIEMSDAKARLAVILGIGTVQQPAPIEIQPPLRQISAPIRQPARVIDAN